MTHVTWDLGIGLPEFKRVLKRPKDPRFIPFFARVLSRVPFQEAFHRFITPAQFRKYYRNVRSELNADIFGAGRIRFWDWLHKRISY